MHASHLHQNCINNAIYTAELVCKNRGLRFTNLRRKVLEIIWASHQPIKAYDILDQLRDSDYSAKPPTVYRTLDFLLENGLIHKLSSLNAYVGCSHPLEHSECYFLICSKCKEIKECCDQSLNRTIYRTADKNKFSIQKTTLEIKGECNACMMKKQHDRANNR